MDSPSVPDTSVSSDAIAALFTLLSSAALSAFGWAFNKHAEVRALTAGNITNGQRLDDMHDRLSKVESSVAVVLDRTENLPEILSDLNASLTRLAPPKE